MRAATVLFLLAVATAGCGANTPASVQPQAPSTPDIQTIAAHRAPRTQYLSQVRKAAPTLRAISDADFLAWARLSCKKQSGPVIVQAPPKGSRLEQALPRLTPGVLLIGLTPPLVQFCGGVFYDNFVRQVRIQLPTLGFLTDSDLDVYETQACVALVQHGPNLTSTDRPVEGKRLLTRAESALLVRVARISCTGGRRAS